jgi:hypothetical protein
VTLLGHGHVGHDLPRREARLHPHRREVRVERLARGRLRVDDVLERRVVGAGEVAEGRGGGAAAHQDEDGSDRDRDRDGERRRPEPRPSEPGEGQAGPMVPRDVSTLFA